MKNCKIYVDGRSKEEEVQKKLFELGCKWYGESTYVKRTDKPFLFVEDNYIRFSDDMDFFSELEEPILTVEELLSMKPERLKHELKPFDKVLVRDYLDERWTISFFRFKNMEDKLFDCIDGTWKECIPYKGNEHLLGTNKNP